MGNGERIYFGAWLTEINIIEEWFKIEGDVYVRRSFDEGETWEAELTGLKEVPFWTVKREDEQIH
jgi:hypothetical protein